MFTENEQENVLNNAKDCTKKYKWIEPELRQHILIQGEDFKTVEEAMSSKIPWPEMD